MGGYDKIDYAVNIVEAYRRAKGLSGGEVAQLFGDAGVFKFLEDFGDTLHCQSDEATIAEIDEFIHYHFTEGQEITPSDTKR